MRELTGAAAERVLSILDVISDGSRVVSLLAPLMRQNDPRLRSKVVLIIGRSIKKPEWVEQHLRDADARTRANAVESLWGAQSPEAQGLFRKAVNDSHRRVATNAMVGLYRLGDPAAVSLLLETSRLRDPRFRSSAAWAMGEACDPRFLPPLRQIDPEPREIVWPSVRSAVERIERAAARMRECGLLDARITGAAILADRSRRLRLAVAAAERWNPSA